MLRKKRKTPLARNVPVHSEPKHESRSNNNALPCTLSTMHSNEIEFPAVYTSISNLSTAGKSVVFKEAKLRDGPNCIDMLAFVGQISFKIWFFFCTLKYLKSNGCIGCQYICMLVYRLKFVHNFPSIFTLQRKHRNWIQFSYKNAMRTCTIDVASQFCQNQTIEKHA